MGRGQQAQAKNIYNESQGVFNTANGRSNALYSQLMPILSGEATNPQGFDPKDLAAMNTASQQSLGGSTQGVVGQGNLTAARSRNAGGFNSSLDEASRGAQRQLSQNALDTQTKNAALREANRQAGISGLGNLYGSNTDELLKSLGLGTGAVNSETQAGQSGWFQNLTGLIGALGQAAQGAGSLLHGH